MYRVSMICDLAYQNPGSIIERRFANLQSAEDAFRGVVRQFVGAGEIGMRILLLRKSAFVPSDRDAKAWHICHQFIVEAADVHAGPDAIDWSFMAERFDKDRN